MSEASGAVIERWTFDGTHKGAYLGIAPSGKHVSVTGCTILRIADGRVVEHWGWIDMMTFLSQVGRTVS